MRASWNNPVFWLVALALSAVLGWVLIQAWDWRIAHDAPLMLYQAWRIDEGALPYRDLFDMNLPGSYATYWAIGKVFGFHDDWLLSKLDLALLGVLLGGMVAWMRRFSWPSAIVSALLFALCYLQLGPRHQLQREFLMLFPIVAATLLAVSRVPPRWRALGVGVCVGLASTIKPHAAIALAPLALFLASEAKERFLVLGVAALGWGLPVGVMFAGMAALGILDDFWLTAAYLRYYGALTGSHEVLPSGEFLPYMVGEFLPLEGYSVHFWIALVVASVQVWRTGGQERRELLLLAGLTGAFVVYPLFSGQFWPYHWLPMVFFLCAAHGLLVLQVPEQRWLGWVGQGALLVVAWFAMNGEDQGAEFQEDVRVHSRPDRVRDFLVKHRLPGETVQPLDWASGGVVHGMLLAEAPIATKFVYAFHFYHHVSAPTIRRIREEFLASFDEARPVWVIQARRPDGRSWVSGPDTVPTWPDLNERLYAGYIPIISEDRYVVWERADHAEARGVWKPSSGPNVLILSVGDVRSETLAPAEGEATVAPNIGGLISRGSWFAQAVTPSPENVAAAASVLTGLYPKAHGIRAPGDSRRLDATTLAEHVRPRGYRTAAVVSDPDFGRPTGLDCAFETYRLVDGASAVTDEALASTVSLDGAPVFLWTHYAAPGGPIGDESLHLDKVRTMDVEVGRLLDGLVAERGDNWLVVLVGTSGMSIGGPDPDGVSEAELHVPMSVVDLRETEERAPAHTPVVEMPVSLTDVAPTLPLLARWNRVKADGRALHRFLTGDLPRGIRPISIFAELGVEEAKTDRRLRVVRRGRWKLVWTPALPEGTDVSLYDLDVDPEGLDDLWEEHQDAPFVDGMIDDLSKWLGPGGPAWHDAEE